MGTAPISPGWGRSNGEDGVPVSTIAFFDLGTERQVWIIKTKLDHEKGQQSDYGRAFLGYLKFDPEILRNFDRLSIGNRLQEKIKREKKSDSF